MIMYESNPPEPPRRSAGRIATLLTAIALFVSGIGIGWLFTEPVSDELTSAPEQVEASFVESTTTTTTLPDTGVEIQTDPLVNTQGDEPVADVAEALLPSVVQIEVVNNGIERGVGTGVIYDASGLVMTAVIAIEGGPYPAAPLALDDKPRPGSLAVALGSPWGLDSTVTAGIVSAVDRTIISNQVPRSMLQTDASINPGNSGGPLVDRTGRVIGINVSIYSASGANDGVGFAVPIDRAFRVSEALVAGGEFVSGFLGVRLDNPADLSAGAVVTDVTSGTAAEAAGIRVGDKVLSINDVAIADRADLGAQVRAFQAGDTVELEIERNGTVETLVIELGARQDQG